MPMSEGFRKWLDSCVNVIDASEDFDEWEQCAIERIAKEYALQVGSCTMQVTRATHASICTVKAGPEVARVARP